MSSESLNWEEAIGKEVIVYTEYCLGNIEKAKEIAGSSFQIDSVSKYEQDPSTLYYLGVLFDKVFGETDSAKACFERCLETERAPLEAHLSYGEQLIQYEEFQRAEVVLKAALRDTNELGAESKAAVYSQLGLLEYKRGNFEEAKKYYEVGLEFLPDDHRFKNNIACCNMGLNQLDVAREMFLEINESGQSDERIKMNILSSMIDPHNPEKMLGLLQSVLEDGWDAVEQEHIYFALHENGKKVFGQREDPNYFVLAISSILAGNISDAANYCQKSGVVPKIHISSFFEGEIINRSIKLIKSNPTYGEQKSLFYFLYENFDRQNISREFNVENNSIPLITRMFNLIYTSRKAGLNQNDIRRLVRAYASSVEEFLDFRDNHFLLRFLEENGIKDAILSEAEEEGKDYLDLLLMGPSAYTTLPSASMAANLYLMASIFEPDNFDLIDKSADFFSYSSKPKDLEMAIALSEELLQKVKPNKFLAIKEKKRQWIAKKSRLESNLPKNNSSKEKPKRKIRGRGIPKKQREEYLRWLERR